MSDYEANLNTTRFYEVTASFLDLFILASFPNRTVVKVLNYYDNCCFFGPAYRDYDNEVRAIASWLGGTFEIYSGLST